MPATVFDGVLKVMPTRNSALLATAYACMHNLSDHAMVEVRKSKGV